MPETPKSTPETTYHTTGNTAKALKINLHTLGVLIRTHGIAVTWVGHIKIIEPSEMDRLRTIVASYKAAGTKRKGKTATE